MMKVNLANVFALLLALIAPLVVCSPAAEGTGAQATIALEKPQFPRVS